MAKKKAKGSTRQHKSRRGKRLGVKIFGGQRIKVGEIILRQRGTKVKAGEGVGAGRDFTLYALRSGKVIFKKNLGRQLVTVEEL